MSLPALFSVFAWAISFEFRLRDDDTQQVSCGRRLIIAKDRAAGRVRNFNTEPFSGNLRNTPAILAGLFQNVSEHSFFQIKKNAKSVHE